ncbi:MAG: Polynucleotide adenylyltransferase/metal dependent phosphohydrolase [candidate division WS6 bacterium GW2011_GWA2_37_6]|uniref:Polynucleotide adenylyltransferase/metal dependent phosphohydrolase n=1 Tax=candidate division WS6 bacterium GW2011_GWA2_37_6 TaxID=1619087 RepID=A0A0G0GVS4_9BACT|nr:MAG: Polynucleotide adenylyltransferase/metal dependent phosphohydrolase [candidate division WS6 bacterium GW2011_GWA2_37_6]
MKIDETITKRVADVLLENGFEAYLVGGSVRDLLTGKEPGDFDIATKALPEDIQKLFPKTVATGAKFGTVIVVMEDRSGERFNVEVTTYRSESDYVGSRWPSSVKFTKSIKEDLERRDFTVNALAIDLARIDEPGAVPEEMVLDLFNGMQDLSDGIIRAVGEPDERFQEDALRMLRACRLASQMEFSIEPATMKSISENLDLLKNISLERVRDEILKMLYKSSKPSVGLDLLRQTGIMKLFLPELFACIGVVQPEYHIDDVYTHTLKVVDMAQDDVKLAALFHDIGKPVTISQDDKGTHFYQHDIEGAKIAEKAMRRLKFSNKEIERTSLLVKHHMFYYPSADWRKNADEQKIDKMHLERLREEGNTKKIVGGWTDAAVRRFIARVGGIDNLNDLIELRIADATANPKSNFTDYEIKALQERIAKVMAEDSAFKITDLAINGNDLINAGVQKGPKIGEILSDLLEDVMENPENNTKEKLLQIVKEKYS